MADDLPLTGLAFERRQWRKQRERQAAAVRKCKAYAAARAANGKGGAQRGGRRGAADGKRERANVSNRADAESLAVVPQAAPFLPFKNFFKKNSKKGVTFLRFSGLYIYKHFSARLFIPSGKSLPA